MVVCTCTYHLIAASLQPVSFTDKQVDQHFWFFLNVKTVQVKQRQIGEKKKKKKKRQNKPGQKIIFFFFQHKGENHIHAGQRTITKI